MSGNFRLVRGAAIFAGVLLLGLTSAAQVVCTYKSFEVTRQGSGSDVFGINKQEATVGVFGIQQGQNFLIHSFHRSPQGKITKFNYPGAVDTSAQGINDMSVVVGFYVNNPHNVNPTGFKLESGKFSAISYPNANATEAFGINNNGDVVGWYAIGSGNPAGFELSQGQFTSFSYPGAVATKPRGINDSGVIVGEWDDGTTHPQHAFIYANGSFQSYDYPGSTGTVFTGINAAGEIVGYYLGTGDNPLPYGFVYQNGNVQMVDIPNAADNIVYGVNAKGDLGGVFQKTAFGNDTAFIGTNCH